MWHREAQWTNAFGKMVQWCCLDTNLQYVKNSVSAKFNKVQCNKMKDACICMLIEMQLHGFKLYLLFPTEQSSPVWGGCPSVVEAQGYLLDCGKKILKTLFVLLYLMFIQFIFLRIFYNRQKYSYIVCNLYINDHILSTYAFYHFLPCAFSWR